MTPSYTFLQRDAAQLSEPKKFTDALIASGRFWRDERGLLWYKVAENDLARIEHRGALREILISGDAIKLSGDLDETAFATMWLWFTARSWTFPRMNPEKPWQPVKPLPVRNAGRGPWAVRS